MGVSGILDTAFVVNCTSLQTCVNRPIHASTDSQVSCCHLRVLGILGVLTNLTDAIYSLYLRREFVMQVLNNV